MLEDTLSPSTGETGTPEDPGGERPEGVQEETAASVEAAAAAVETVQEPQEAAAVPTGAEVQAQADPATEEPPSASTAPPEAQPQEQSAQDVAQPSPQTESEGEEESVEDYERSFPQLEKGEVIKGTVVHIDREGVLVDVRAKSEGIIKPGELSRDETAQAEDVVKVGEEIDVVVLEAESADGSLLLSKKRADFEKAWDRVIEAKETGKIINAMVTDCVKGGLVVDLGIRGFVPRSHVGSGTGKVNLERFVGDSIPLKVIEVDKDRRKVVLSHKLAVEEDRESRRKETFQSLKIGQIRHGKVRRIVDYGAFIDLGGVDGLLHISEMSWTRINHPSEVVKEGQEIDVQVLRLDPEHGKVSLGLRQILPDPWSEIEKEYHVGDIIEGTVARIVPFGVFVQVKHGVEGIIPSAELSYRRGVKAQDVVQIGEKVNVKVIDIRPEERRLTLSLRQARHEEESRRERQAVEQHQARAEREAPRYTIGDAIKEKDKGEDNS